MWMTNLLVSAASSPLHLLCPSHPGPPPPSELESCPSTPLSRPESGALIWPVLCPITVSTTTLPSLLAVAPHLPRHQHLRPQPQLLLLLPPLPLPPLLHRTILSQHKTKFLLFPPRLTRVPAQLQRERMSPELTPSVENCDGVYAEVFHSFPYYTFQNIRTEYCWNVSVILWFSLLYYKKNREIIIVNF